MNISWPCEMLNKHKKLWVVPSAPWPSSTRCVFFGWTMETGGFGWLHGTTWKFFFLNKISFHLRWNWRVFERKGVEARLFLVVQYPMVWWYHEIMSISRDATIVTPKMPAQEAASLLQSSAPTEVAEARDVWSWGHDKQKLKSLDSIWRLTRWVIVFFPQWFNTGLKNRFFKGYCYNWAPHHP